MTPGGCQNCVHYRQPAFLGLLLRNEAGQSGSLAQVIQSALDQERQTAATEAKWVQAQVDLFNNPPSAGAQAGDEWPERPVEHAYCGRDERAERYGVCEIRNMNGDCPSMQPGTPPRRPCDSCRWRVDPGGRAEALRLQVQMASSADGMAGWGQQPPFRPPAPGEGIAEGIAVEFEEAFRSEPVGVLSQPPAYLRYCGRRSQVGAVWLCIARNRCDRCPDWEGEPTQTAAPAGTFWLRPGQTYEHPQALGIRAAIALNAVDRDYMHPQPPKSAVDPPFLVVAAPGRNPCCFALSDLPDRVWVSARDERGEALPVQFRLVPNIGVEGRWQDPAQPGGLSKAGDQWISPAASPASGFAPFRLEPGRQYRHPEIDALRLQYSPWGGQPIETGLPRFLPGPVLILGRPLNYRPLAIGLARLPTGAWVRLTDEAGVQLAVGVYVDPRGSVYGCWLPLAQA